MVTVIPGLPRLLLKLAKRALPSCEVKRLEAAWGDVAVSFDRFCLTAGIATLAEMMERDAAELCGPRHGRNRDRRGYRWGTPRANSASTVAK